MQVPARGRSIAQRARQALRIVLAFWYLSLAGQLGAQVSREYDIKGVFLLNFAQFTDWPARCFADPSAPLVIGILGNDPFGSTLSDIVANERVRDRSVRVERYRRVEDVQDTHILYISNSESRRLRPILNSLRSRPILTVSDMPEFASSGGMIEFFSEASKVRLRINNEAARAAELALSSKLLRVATVIPDSKR